MQMIVTSDGPETTEIVGRAMGGLLAKCPATLLLIGDLGVGKTTLTKAIVAGMGLSDLVVSPTYALVNTYGTEAQKAYHFDLYRLEDFDELLEIGFDEFVTEGVPVIIEWPQILGDYTFDRSATVTLEYTDHADERRITIETTDEQLAKGLECIG